MNPLTDQDFERRYSSRDGAFFFILSANRQSNSEMQMCWILGLTGGAGSGKSTAADIFRELGLPIIDADRISRAVTAAGGAAVPAIRQAFGPEMIEISGAMNRARMRELVFQDLEARKKLEAIVHSAMKQVLDDEFACAKRSGVPFAVYDCPLLIESPQARARVDRILVIDVPEYLQVERLGTRSGLTPDAALRLIRAQTSRCNRLQAADDVLVNAGTREDFARRVRHYALRLLEAAEKHLL